MKEARARGLRDGGGSVRTSGKWGHFIRRFLGVCASALGVLFGALKSLTKMGN